MERFELIRKWAKERGLYEKGNPITQYVKLQEECGELANALLKNNEHETVDAIGDIVVVLTNLAYQKGYLIEDCIDKAYEVIKNRQGKMTNGTFVKETAKNTFELSLHKNGYYNLPCKFKDIISFMKENDLIINGKRYTNEDNLHRIAKPSKNGGVAYLIKYELS